eukprot:scaffold66505_cov14-Prasinocladus_malaysianus.AAC.1
MHSFMWQQLNYSDSRGLKPFSHAPNASSMRLAAGPLPRGYMPTNVTLAKCDTNMSLLVDTCKPAFQSESVGANPSEPYDACFALIEPHGTARLVFGLYYY